MGDADSTEILMTAEDVEHWMDHALNDVDRGLDILFSFMNLLNDRTVQMISELMAWHRFRRCFAAFNLFVLPIMLAIGLVYGTSETLEPRSNIEAFLQMVVMLLMFLSWSIGLPLYIFSMWQAYFTWTKLEQNSSMRVSNTDSGSTTGAIVDESNLPLPFAEDSLLLVGRMINRRMRDNIRLEFQRRAEAVIRSTSMTNSETSDNLNDEDVSEINLQRQTETDADGGTQADILQSDGVYQKDLSEAFGVKVFIMNASKSLSVEIDKEDSSVAMEESGQEPPDDQHELPLTSSIRSIPVEHVGEGLYISDPLKRDEESMELIDL